MEFLNYTTDLNFLDFLERQWLMLSQEPLTFIVLFGIISALAIIGLRSH